MKLSSIPNRDVRARVRKRLVKETLICVGIDAVLIAVLVATRSFSPAYITLVAILCIAPYVKFKYWNWFTDRTYEGEVTDVKQTEHVERTTLANVAPGNKLIYVFAQDIKIVESNGNIIRVRLQRRQDESAPIYAAGDHVRHYYGTKYMQKIGDDKAPICVFCGTQNLKGESKCGVCGVGLIDNAK